MKIATYLSIGYHQGTERSLQTYPYLFNNIVSYTNDFICKFPQKQIPSIISQSSELQERLMIKLPILHYACLASRRIMEIDTILHSIPKNIEWVIIIRPLCGWVSSARYKSLIKTISNVTNPIIKSIIRLSSIGHPLWNNKHLPNSYEHQKTLRIAHYSEEHIHGFNELNIHCPHQRSQDINNIYHDDAALFAIQASALKNYADNKPSAHLLLHNEEGEEDTPWYFSFPLHELHEQADMDLQDIENFLEKKHHR